MKWLKRIAAWLSGDIRRCPTCKTPLARAGAYDGECVWCARLNHLVEVHRREADVDRRITTSMMRRMVYGPERPR